MTPQTTAAPDQGGGPSEFTRIVNTFVEPKSAFADIAQRPRWIVPMALLVAISLAFMFAYASHIGWERMLTQQMESNSRLQQLTQEQRDRAMEMQMKFVPVLGYAGAVVGVPVFALVVAGVLLFVFKVMMSLGVTFKQMFAIVTYAMLPRLISAATSIALVFLKNPDDFNLRNPNGFNAGAYLDPLTTSKGLMAVASSLDLFTIWTLLLIAVGVSAVAPRQMSFGKALMPILVLWIIVVLGKTGFVVVLG